MENNKYTYEFMGHNYIASIPAKRSLRNRLSWFFNDIYLGFQNGYPWCCIWYYTKLSFLQVPVAAYDHVIKGKRDNKLGRVVCDKCYKRMNP